MSANREAAEAGDERSHALPIRSFYFCLCAGIAALGPYLPLYYKSHALAGWQLGLLTGLPPFIALFAGPLWGLLADATRQHRAILMGALAMTASTAMALTFAARFPPILGCVIVYALFACTIVPLIDSTTLQILGERRGDYGRHRAWGTIGYMLLSVPAAWVFKQWGFRACFGIYSGFILLTMATAAVLPRISAGPRVFLWRGVKVFAGQQQWRIFLGICILCGVAYSLVANYLFLYMDGLGIPPAYKGWAMVSSTLSETPVMLFGALLLRRFGARRLLGTAALLFAVRCVIYAHLNSGWSVLAMQLTHGVTFGFMWIGGTGLAHELAPPGMAATAQGLFSGACMGLGNAIGAQAGGMIVAAHGPRAMFAWIGYALVAGCVVLVPKLGSKRTA